MPATAHRSAHWAHRPEKVDVALWFHDAIYDVRAPDNEARSADWALAALQSAGASSDQAILGAAPARFAEYERQIRQEYAWVPQALFVDKRRAVLQQFAARPQLYSTAYFQARLEAAARCNLQQALQTSYAPS